MDLPRGMKDFENNEFSKIEFVREKFLETSKVFGYKLMEPSPIESLSTLEAKSGESFKDDIYFSLIRENEKLHYDLILPLD